MNIDSGACKYISASRVAVTPGESLHGAVLKGLSTLAVSRLDGQVGAMLKHVTRARPDLVLGLGIFMAGAGIVRVGAGVVAWAAIRSQLAAERIVIPDSASRLSGRRVVGPLSALAEAETVRNIALTATGGRTYGDMDEGDGSARMALDASLIRSSLYTSVVAFGEAMGEIATGLGMAGTGVAVALLARRTAFP